MTEVREMIRPDGVAGGSGIEAEPPTDAEASMTEAGVAQDA